MNFPIALKLNIRGLEGPLLYPTKGRWKATAPAVSYNGHHNRQLFWMGLMSFKYLVEFWDEIEDIKVERSSSLPSQASDWLCVWGKSFNFSKISQI